MCPRCAQFGVPFLLSQLPLPLSTDGETSLGVAERSGALRAAVGLPARRGAVPGWVSDRGVMATESLIGAVGALPIVLI